jgi:pimeloyl-ACP methyl ester carboxylesterase
VQRLVITSGGHRLAADLHPAAPAAARPLAFVVTHGWGSARPRDIPAALAAAGCTALAHDLRGHGESEGHTTATSRAEWVADVVSMIDRLREEVDAGIPIGLVGASFGAYLSVLATRARPVHCLSLRVPADYADDGFDQPLPAQLAAGGETAAVRALRAFAGPVQIIDAEHDAVVPPRLIASYAAAVPAGRLRRSTLRGAPHHLATPQLRGEYIRLLTGWVDGLVASPAS